MGSLPLSRGLLGSHFWLEGGELLGKDWSFGDGCLSLFVRLAEAQNILSTPLLLSRGHFRRRPLPYFSYREQNGPLHPHRRKSPGMRDLFLGSGNKQESHLSHSVLHHGPGRGNLLARLSPGSFDGKVGNLLRLYGDHRPLRRGSPLFGQSDAHPGCSRRRRLLGLLVSLEKGPAAPNHFTFFLERRDLCSGADSMKMAVGRPQNRRPLFPTWARETLP